MPTTQDILREYYGDPRRSLRNPALEAVAPDPYYLEPAPPRRRPELRDPAKSRPGDPLLGQVYNEDVAARFGQNTARGNWLKAIQDAVELAMVALPGAKGGKGRGPKGSEGPARKGAGAGPEAGGLPDRGGVGGGDRWLSAPGGPLDPYVAIPGQPSVFKLPGHGELEARPIPQIEAAAREYAASKGRPYEVAESFEPLSIERSQRIAEAYRAMKHDPHNPDVAKAYAALNDEIYGQYMALKNKGFRAFFNEGGVDPYAKSPALGYLDLRDKGQLSIFPTIEGHGSKGAVITPAEVRNNPLLEDSGQKFGDKPALMNDLFRFIHDAYGHHGPGNPFFRGPGEDRAFGHHAMMFGDRAKAAAASELRGQNSELNYGTHAEFNKGKSGADTIYADQKVGLMPSWTWEEGMPKRRVLIPPPGTIVD
jgi:hypothetical protein